MPGTPSMPLPPTVISAWPARRRQRLDRVFVQRPARRDLGAGRRSGSRERAHEHGQRPARDRDQRARVQHLGAVVGQLRRLAQVQLRDDARVGDHARIGGQQARDVFPQRHLARAQRPPQQRRGQVGAAASQRRHRALLQRAAPRRLRSGAADEPGNDRNLAGRDQRLQPLARRQVGQRQVGRRAAERAFGEHDLGRVDVDGRRSRRGQRRREHLRRQPLAAADDEVARARGQLLERGQAGRAGSPARRASGRSPQRPRPSFAAGRACRRPRRSRSRGSACAAPRRRGPAPPGRPCRPRRRASASPSSTSVMPAGADTTTTGAARRPLHDGDGVPEGGAVAQRRAPELVHLDDCLAWRSSCGQRDITSVAGCGGGRARRPTRRGRSDPARVPIHVPLRLPLHRRLRRRLSAGRGHLQVPEMRRPARGRARHRGAQVPQRGLMDQAVRRALPAHHLALRLGRVGQEGVGAAPRRGRKRRVDAGGRDEPVVGRALRQEHRPGRAVGQAVRRLAHRVVQGPGDDGAGVDGQADDRRRQADPRGRVRVDRRHLGGAGGVRARRPASAPW